LASNEPKRLTIPVASRSGWAAVIVWVACDLHRDAWSDRVA
jgi:hypothetical protein